MRKRALIVIITIPLVFLSLIAFGFDADADQIIDWYDNCPNKVNPNQENFDGDSWGDACDIDNDNDGIVNGIDAFPKNPDEWDDFDFDGIGANEDEDDDNDGILDINDSSPSYFPTLLTKKYLDLIENCAVIDPGFPRQQCFSDFFVSLIKKGEKTSEVIILLLFYVKLNTIEDCHFTSHNLGYASFQENPNLTEILISSSNICRAGFTHGVMLAFFENLKKEGMEISNLHNTICDEFVNTLLYQPCTHGIGHGLVVYYEDDLSSAVDTCHELSDIPSHSCLSGVMMQYSEDELTKSTSFEEVLPEICSKIELTNEDRRLCYFQTGRTLGFLTNHDVLKGIEFCEPLDEKDEFDCLAGLFKEFTESGTERHAPIVYV